MAAPADLKGVTSRSGSSIARTPDESLLVVADEDHRALDLVALPVDAAKATVKVELPGPPAQVVALGDRILVTVREPGLLVELVRDGATLRETGRVDLPWDAWGIGVSADGKTAVVTSAWHHAISGVDLAALKVTWSVNAAREPRGVAIASSGVAYVSHLVGSRATKIEGIDGATPKVSRFDVMPSPMRTPPGGLLDASLGYSLLLSPDETRLFLPRHALGAEMKEWWWGAGTVDVIATKDFSPLSPAAAKGVWSDPMTAEFLDVEGLAVIEPTSFVAPRGAVYRKTTSTLLVASEGTNQLVELDARALDPSLTPLRKFTLETREDHEFPATNLVLSGGAPSGVALSADEKTAYVSCRSTGDLAVVALDAPKDSKTKPEIIHLSDDALDADASAGRRLFYDAVDPVMSGGLSCASCHPDGRDDGHVWREMTRDEADQSTGYHGAPIRFEGFFGTAPRKVGGLARQTPMLAGRLGRDGPYGWRGESPNLETRVRVGFSLHHWGGSEDQAYGAAPMERPKLIAAFARKGLVPPGSPPRPPNDEEQRGAEIFRRQAVGCVKCHNPDTGFTSSDLAALDRSHPPGINPESSTAFKVPSLLFVGGTPPYYRDALVNSLEDLVNNNGTAMGDTSHLDAAERAALIAYLRTIGGYVEPFPSDEPPKRPRIADLFASSTHPGRAPQHAEWYVAPTVGTVAGSCKLHHIDAYWCLECPEGSEHSGVGPRLISGSTVGVDDFEQKDKNGEATAFYSVFSLEPGDRRILQLLRTGGFSRFGRYGGMEAFPAGVIQAFWLEGDPAPILIY